MVLGERLRAIRESKHLSQGDIERKTGLLRCYISRVEHGHTVPSIETLEKLAHSLEVPLYQVFHDGNKKAKTLKLPPQKALKLSAKDSAVLSNIAPLLGKMKDRDKSLLVAVARKMSAA